jgi:hypothetical protein
LDDGQRERAVLERLDLVRDPVTERQDSARHESARVATRCLLRSFFTGVILFLDTIPQLTRLLSSLR